jgi:ABC-type multidrug transport system fused ATPase/permease subunit
MTIIVITHRLSMVRGADRILVLDQGRVVESRVDRVDACKLDVVGR